jgi:hypothetical protein
MRWTLNPRGTCPRTANGSCPSEAVMIIQEMRVRVTATNAFLIMEIKRKTWAMQGYERERERSSDRKYKPRCGYFFVNTRQTQRMREREANPDTPRAASSRALRRFRNVFKKISKEESPLLFIPSKGGSCEVMIWIADPVTNPPTAGAGKNSTNHPSLSAPRRKMTTPWRKKALSDKKGCYCSTYA